MTAAAPQQPGLRAFLVYDRAPPDHLPFLVTDDDTAPLLRPGDTVLVDTRKHEPEAGELFLVEYGRHGPDPTRRIVQMSALPLRGGAVAPVGWVLAAYNRPRSRREVEAWIRAARPLRGIDGPYSATRPEGVAELRGKLIGRVAGILEPAFAEPMRLVGEARR